MSERIRTDRPKMKKNFAFKKGNHFKFWSSDPYFIFALLSELISYFSYQGNKENKFYSNLDFI